MVMRFNEAAANEALEAQAEQDRIDARQLAAAEANKEKRQSTTIDSSWFIARAMKFITVVTVAAVAYKLIIMFWS